MQKFLEFVFAVLFWLGDCCLLFIESCKDGIFGIIQEVIKIIDKLSEWGDIFNYYASLQKAPKPARPPRKKPTSFLGKIFYKFNHEIMVTFTFGMVIYLVPVFTEFVLDFVEQAEANPQSTAMTLLIVIVFFLPQQRLFRDPVTRYFFDRGWFRHYGGAVYCAQVISFFIMSYLICYVW